MGRNGREWEEVGGRKYTGISWKMAVYGKKWDRGGGMSLNKERGRHRE